MMCLCRANTSGSVSHSSALCEMTTGIYLVAEYARSDSWMVCAKAAGCDVMVPVPGWTLVAGYNERMHQATFVLPQSGHAILEEEWNMLPLFGRHFRLPWSNPIRLNDFLLALSLIGFFLYRLPGTIAFVLSPVPGQNLWGGLVCQMSQM